MKVMMLQPRPASPDDAAGKALAKGAVHDLPDKLAIGLLAEGAALPARDRQPAPASLPPPAGERAEVLQSQSADDEPADKTPDKTPGEPKTPSRKR